MGVGWGFSPSCLSLSSWRWGHYSAPLSCSWHGCVPPLFSWWTWGHACPWRTWAAPWLTVHRERSLPPNRSCPHELGVLGEAPMAMAVPQLAHVLSHLVSLVEAPGHGVAQSHGWCSVTAPAAEGCHIVLILKIIDNIFLVWKQTLPHISLLLKYLLRAPGWLS